MLTRCKNELNGDLRSIMILLAHYTRRDILQAWNSRDECFGIKMSSWDPFSKSWLDLGLNAVAQSLGLALDFESSEVWCWSWKSQLVWTCVLYT